MIFLFLLHIFYLNCLHRIVFFPRPISLNFSMCERFSALNFSITLLVASNLLCLSSCTDLFGLCLWLLFLFLVYYLSFVTLFFLVLSICSIFLCWALSDNFFSFSFLPICLFLSHANFLSCLRLNFSKYLQLLLQTFLRVSHPTLITLGFDYLLKRLNNKDKKEKADLGCHWQLRDI